MNRVLLGRAGLALMRRPWATRMAFAWGIRRALRTARGMSHLTFLGGLGVGAGLMYLIAGRNPEPPARRAAPRRDPRATPARKARAQAARRPKAPAR
jgi:hypothetical protein